MFDHFLAGEGLMKDKNYDDFFDEKTSDESPAEKLMTMVETADESAPKQDLESGKMTSGTICSIGKEFVFVEVGQKNEAVIKINEFKDAEGNCTVKIGDTIEAYVLSTKNDEIIMSKSLSGRKGSSSDLIDAMKNVVPVEGKITGINKGGFNVNVLGKKAFCPFSHIDSKYVDDPNTYLLKSFQFIISRVENRGRNIVLSRLPLVEKGLHAKLDDLEKNIKSKTVIKGQITKITKFGLFVDLGETEGLVHISEVSWDRAENLSQLYKDGEVVECIILKIERKEPLRNSKISLSMKLVGENPWDSVSEKLAIGSSVHGTITRLANFGAFVQLQPGIEGLIHISEMSWGKRVRHASDIVSVGQEVKVTILAIDDVKKSVSCSLKDISENPWNNVSEKYPEGSTVTGTVASETKYGFFIDLDENITGLLIHNKVAKDKKGSIKKGDKIEVGINDIDIEKNRISLSYGVVSDNSEKINKEAFKSIQTSSNTKKGSSEFGEMLKAAMQKKK